MNLLDISIVVSGMLILVFVITVVYTLKKELKGDATLNRDALIKLSLQCSLWFFSFIFACIAFYLGYLSILGIFSFEVYSIGLFFLMWVFIILLYWMLNLIINLG